MSERVEFFADLTEAVNPKLIKSNNLQECENMETASEQGSLEKRKAVEVFDAALNAKFDSWLWNVIKVSDPVKFNNLPTDIDTTMNYVLLVYAHQLSGFKLFMVYKGEDGIWKYETFPGLDSDGIIYKSNSYLRFFISSDNVLIADSENPDHEVGIDVENVIYSKILGILEPQSILTLEDSDEWNEYEESDTDNDKGMSVERGVIVQYCYAVKDKAGNMSNCGPVATFTKQQYRYPDGTYEAGFKYYWKHTAIKNAKVPLGISDETKERLDKLCFYRRHTDYTEGNIGFGDFTLIMERSISSKEFDMTDDACVYIDDNPIGSENRNDTNDIAPVSNDICEVGGVKVVPGVKTHLRFLYPHKAAYEIKLNNINNRAYVKCKAELRFDENSISLADALFEDLRGGGVPPEFPAVVFFDMDLMTPLPGVFIESEDSIRHWDIVLEIPYIRKNSVHSIWLVVIDPGKYAARFGNDFDIPDAMINKYGTLLDGTDAADWALQTMFENAKALDSNTIFCANFDEESSGTDDVPNRCNNNEQGVQTNSAYGTGGVNYIPRFGDGKKIPGNNNTMDFSASADDVTYKMALARMPEKGLIFGKLYFQTTLGVYKDIITLWKDSSNYQNWHWEYVFPTLSVKMHTCIGGSITSRTLFSSTAGSNTAYTYVFTWDFEAGRTGFARIGLNDNTLGVFYGTDIAAPDDNDFSMANVIIGNGPTGGSNSMSINDFVIIKDHYLDLSTVIGRSIAYALANNMTRFDTAMLGYQFEKWYWDGYITILADFGGVAKIILTNFGSDGGFTAGDSLTIRNSTVGNDGSYMIGSISYTSPTTDIRLTTTLTANESEVGSPDLEIRSHAHNVNVEFGERKEAGYKKYGNRNMYSNINQDAFPALNSIRIREEGLRCVPFPSMLDQYNNNVLLLTHEGMYRLVFSGDTDTWATNTGNMIPEKRLGILAKNGLVVSSKAIYVPTKLGLFVWEFVNNTQGLLSKNRVNFPKNTELIGGFIPERNQAIFGTSEITNDVAGTYAGKNYTWHCTADDYAYVVKDGKLLKLDISNESDITLSAEADIDTNAGEVKHITMGDSMVFVTCDNGIHCSAISDLTRQSFFSVSGGKESIYDAANNKLYTAFYNVTDGPSFHVIDYTSFTVPAILGTHNILNEVWITSICYSGNTVYAGSFSESASVRTYHFKTFDVTTPASITETGSLNLGVSSSIERIVYDSNTCFVTGIGMLWGQIDVTTPAAPTLDYSIKKACAGYDIVLDTNDSPPERAFIANMDKITMVDYSTPGSPVETEIYNSPEHGGLVCGSVTTIVVDAKVLVCLTDTWEGFLISGLSGTNIEGTAYIYEEDTDRFRKFTGIDIMSIGHFDGGGLDENLTLILGHDGYLYKYPGDAYTSEESKIVTKQFSLRSETMLKALKKLYLNYSGSSATLEMRVYNKKFASPYYLDYTIPNALITALLSGEGMGLPNGYLGEYVEFTITEAETIEDFEFYDKERKSPQSP